MTPHRNIVEAAPIPAYTLTQCHKVGGEVYCTILIAATYRLARVVECVCQVVEFLDVGHYIVATLPYE